VALGLPQAHGPNIATVHRVLSQADPDRFEHDLRQWLVRHDIEPKQVVAAQHGASSLHGVHGEQMPGVRLLADLAAEVRTVASTSRTAPSPAQRYIHDLPAMILAGNQDPASM